MITFAVDIDTSALLKVILASLLGTSALTIVLTTAVVGATRFAELRGEGRAGPSAAYGALMVLGIVGLVAAITFGLIVMTSK